jgi:hypothetical protein
VSLAENACALHGEKSPTNPTVASVALAVNQSRRLQYDENLLSGLWTEHAGVRELRPGCTGLDLNEAENAKLRRGDTYGLQRVLKGYPKSVLRLTHEIAQTSVGPSIIFAN